jgi:hypothetical protein
MTEKEVAKSVYDDYYQKFFEDPTHHNAAMKFMSWGDYVEEHDPTYTPENIQAIRKAEDKYNKLCDEGKSEQYWRTCSECRETFSGYKDETICENCKE